MAVTALTGNALAGLLDAAPDAIVAVDEAGEIVLVNVQTERLFGYLREDLVGRHVELLLPDALASSNDGISSYIADPKPRAPVCVQLTGRRRDGSEFPAEISVSASLTDSRILISAAIRDATERVNTEAEHGRFETKANRWRVKAESDIAKAEGARVEAEGEKIEAELVRLEAERELLKAEGEKTEAERVRLEAESVRLKAESVRLEREAERERLESQLHQSQRMESLGQLAGGVAHDFNNLLSVILNCASFVAEELSKAVKTPTGAQWVQTLEDVEQIQFAGQRASLLTHQFLAFARREIVEPRILNLNTAITRTEQILRRTIGEHVELVIDLVADLPSILADPGQIEQIVLNLAINARDAMPAGGTLTIDTSARRISEDDVADDGAPAGLYVCFRVSDTGMGMSSEVRDHAFEPFFTTKPKGEGSGLGLATVYGIVSQSGGYVRLTSEAGAGTTVTILFPSIESDAARDGPDEHEGHLNASGGTETILLVEDEEAIREVMRRILTRNGYNVLPASGGAEAMELIAAHAGPIDLVLTDVIMPKMQGKAVADEVSRRRPGIRVLFMSGFAHPILGAEVTRTADFRLVEKPFDEGTLLGKVRAVLDAVE